MKTNATFKPFDVVKLNANSTIITNHPNAKDFYGIVRDINPTFSFVEWYNKKSAIATAEALTDVTWIPNDELEPVGSLYHLLAKAITAAVTPATAMNVAVTDKPKRKYTRKEGAAKPGPKPKKEKTVKAEKPKRMTKAEKIAAELEAAAKNGPEIVPFPCNGWGEKINDFDFRGCNYGMATGKFKYFGTREDIERSIRQSGCTYYGTIASPLDFIIIGEKPGPSKIAKLNCHFKRIARINEKQWLALLGSSQYKFSDEDEARVKNRPTNK